jgi:DNA ligase-1
MRFSEMADVFAKLDETGGRLAAVRSMANLFARLPATELEPAVYLLQGQLRPSYEGVEIGLGERLLMRALAQAYATSGAIVGRELRKAGDLGLVAGSLAPAKAHGSLTIRQAYLALLKVSRATGAGSIEGRVRLFTSLLRRATPREARYLVRIAQGRLRLGIGDATILEAAALGALGDRAKKRRIEQAYNVRSDLGGVIRLAFSRGERGLARLAPRVGTPVRPALAQRLGSAEAIIRRLGTVQVEPKYDGLRLQLHRDGNRAWVFSRRLENVTVMFPDLAMAARRQLRARRAIIEGEAVVEDSATGKFLPFQVTMTRKRTHGVGEAVTRHPLRFFAFDLLYDGRSWLPKPLGVRHRRLAALIRKGSKGPIAVTEARTVTRPGELQRYFEAMVRGGHEGIMAKRLDAPYRAGARGYDWVKLKRSYQSALRDTVDLVIVGYLAGRGRRSALGIGSLLGAVYDPRRDRFRTVAKIGSGLSDKEWKGLRARLDRQATSSRPARVEATIQPDVWVAPRIVIEVLADEITRSPRHTCGKAGSKPGYALRFPRLIGMRDDKASEDATTETEIVQLYRLQGPALSGRRRRKRRS